MKKKVKQKTRGKLNQRPFNFRKIYLESAKIRSTNHIHIFVE